MSNDDDETKKQVDKSGLKNMGSLDKFQFYDQMSKSFVMVGVGQPRISPSPWDALCMGVPVSVFFRSQLITNSYRSLSTLSSSGMKPTLGTGPSGMRNNGT